MGKRSTGGLHAEWRRMEEVSYIGHYLIDSAGVVGVATHGCMRYVYALCWLWKGRVSGME